MTNLSRITAKIFGETATTTGDDPEIGQFGSALAGTYVGTGDVATIQNLPAWSNGFIDSVTPSTQFPPLPEMTGFGKVLSYQTAYTMQKGVPEWDASTVYYTGDFCKGVGEGKLYVSLADNNLNHAVSDTTYWEEFSSGGGYEINDLVWRLAPTKDSGKHLLDGALLQYGSYKAYIDYMADLYEEYPPTVVTKYFRNTQIVLPTFTSNTQDGITISDARSNTTVLQAILNGSNQSNTIGAWSTYWLNIDYGQNTFIDSYTIQADNSGSPEYPSAWTLQGSNNGTDWDILDTQNGVTFSLNQSKTFSVNAQQVYQQYRLVFSNGVQSGNNGEIKRITFNAYSVISKQYYENSVFATEAQWQQSVTDYGSCGKFVYDSVNNTIRLPKVSDILQGTTDLTALGDLVEAGLPNIEAQLSFTRIGGNAVASGAFTTSSEGTSPYGGGGGTANSAQLAIFNASASNSIYNNSNTVQPQTILGLIYIVIANSTKTQIQVDIDEIATDLNGKADVDLTNVSNTSGFRKLVELYKNGTSWYKVFREYDTSTGNLIGLWCEQGGLISSNSGTSVSLLKSYADTNYSILLSGSYSSAGSDINTVAWNNKTTSSFTYYKTLSNGTTWYACGYIA